MLGRKKKGDIKVMEKYGCRCVEGSIGLLNELMDIAQEDGMVLMELVLCAEEQGFLKKQG